MGGSTGYEPLNTLKEIAPGLWIVDGPAISFYGMPFSTRATVARLSDGTLWVHSPTRLTPSLKAELEALGPVAHLVAPNWIHYAHVAEWQEAFPKAKSWAAPGVAKRARKKGMEITFDADLKNDPPVVWGGEIGQMIVSGSKMHREAVFFHRASRTLILTDLIENFEPDKLPTWMGWLARLAGIAAPDGHMPPDMKATFDKKALAGDVRRMIGWGPERVILAHGAWVERDAVDFVEKAFHSVLRH